LATLHDHPTVRNLQNRKPLATVSHFSATRLKAILLECGADDVGLIRLARPEIADQRDDILACFPETLTLAAFVVRMNREPVVSPIRSISNLEFHQTTDAVNAVAREAVRRLAKEGVRAMNPPSGFPMEMQQFPGKVWYVSHKPVAIAAGLGQMGVHRNVIHPRFGNFIILGTLLIGSMIDVEDRPVDYNPCLSCKLCVAACPVGAIKPDGAFDPSACLTHNYREFMGGFTDIVHQIAESASAADYSRRVSDPETASLWQSLSFGANYKAAYCLAVCPAGEEVITPFLDNRGEFVARTLKPLQSKAEPVYVVPGSDAEEYVQHKFPHKSPRRVAGPRPSSIAGFLSGMPIIFQRGRAKNLDAVYHFTFAGSEKVTATVTIRNGTLDIQSGLVGVADCAVTADAATWIGFLRKERSIVWAIIRRRVRVKGKLSLLKEFGKCFPS
jgi:ferredoxin